MRHAMGWMKWQADRGLGLAVDWKRVRVAELEVRVVFWS